MEGVRICCKWQQIKRINPTVTTEPTSPYVGHLAWQLRRLHLAQPGVCSPPRAKASPSCKVHPFRCPCGFQLEGCPFRGPSPGRGPRARSKRAPGRRELATCLLISDRPSTTSPRPSPASPPGAGALSLGRGHRGPVARSAAFQYPSVDVEVWHARLPVRGWRQVRRPASVCQRSP